jgi:glycosyltransferase involved in cell wall biosynthesis
MDESVSSLGLSLTPRAAVVEGDLRWDRMRRSDAVPAGASTARSLATGEDGRASARQARISVVVPCYNEERTVAPLIERVAAACRVAGVDFEVILVNDGSVDATWDRIQELSARLPAIVGIDLSRNFGKEIALMAGLDQARGDAIIFMDGDLQHPPESIPALIAAWRGGAEIVDAVRDDRVGQRRTDRVMARLFYRLFGMLSGLDLPHDVGDFRLIDARVAGTLRAMRERQRFTKGLLVWVGYHRVRVRYKQAPPGDPRRAAMATWSRLRLAAVGITSFSGYPLRIWSLLGFVFAGGGFSYLAFRIIRAFFHGIDTPGFETIIAIMLFFGGLQLITLGILGDYIGRIYDEAKGRPLYIVRERTAAADRSDEAPAEARHTIQP